MEALISNQNVEIVLAALARLRESYESGAATDGLLDVCAPDIRVDARHRVFNPAVYEGSAGVRRAIEDVLDAWEDFHESNEQLIDAGDRVVVIGTIGGRGRASNAHVEQKGALICTVRDGLIQLIEVFTHPREALKAVGLEE
jgi:ketosteroid isomerase-like protein